MTALERLYNAAVVPVVVLDDAADAVPTAKALLAGGVDVMEITFRTAAAADSITAVAKECPDMFVGAGTVITLEQCKKAVACGAKFIVSPGYSEEVVSWCVENNVAIFLPGKIHGCEDQAYIIYYNESGGDSGEGCFEIEVVDKSRLLALFEKVNGNEEEFFKRPPDEFGNEWFYCPRSHADFSSYADLYPSADFISSGNDKSAEMNFLVAWAKG